MICPVKWVPWSLESVEVISQVENTFSNSFFVILRASALQQGMTLTIKQKWGFPQSPEEPASHPGFPMVHSFLAWVSFSFPGNKPELVYFKFSNLKIILQKVLTIFLFLICVKFISYMYYFVHAIYIITQIMLFMFSCLKHKYCY